MLMPSGGSILTLYVPGGRPETLYLPSASVLRSNCLSGPLNRIFAPLTGGNPCSYGRLGLRNITSPKIVPPGAALDNPLKYSRSAAAFVTKRVREQILV